MSSLSPGYSESFAMRFVVRPARRARSARAFSPLEIAISGEWVILRVLVLDDDRDSRDEQDMHGVLLALLSTTVSNTFRVRRVVRP